jgi:hypothetical protein
MVQPNIIGVYANECVSIDVNELDEGWSRSVRVSMLPKLTSDGIPIVLIHFVADWLFKICEVKLYVVVDRVAECVVRFLRSFDFTLRRKL